MAEYYRHRAWAGLIVAEATGINMQGLGWPYAAGIWNAAQTNVWEPIVNSVHEAGGGLSPSSGI